MSDSLKDQLISLGLAKKEPPRKKRKKPARKQGARGKGKGGEISLDAAYRARNKDEKQTAEQAKAEKRAEDLRRRKINKEIQTIVDEHRLNDEKAELKRNFIYKGRIRSVLVNEQQLKQLNEGGLALIFLRGNYHVVEPGIAEQVQKLSADHVPDLSASVAEEEEEEGDHPVPDDLVW